MTAPRMHAPAKLNLGLEVLGRRPDGYHEIATIFQAVTLTDELTLEGREGSDLVLTTDAPELGGPDNLALRALDALRQDAGINTGAHLHLTKRIPTAAGLGGASSDAASALILGSRLWHLRPTRHHLRPIAARLGSDVPFFLQGGAAMATGRGDRLEPLPPLGRTTFVVVVPRVEIPRKTATLYAALTEGDFTPGDRVRAQADRMATGRTLDPHLLGNAFARPLSALRPEVAVIAATMSDLGAPWVALSGAGPGHYTALDDPRAARDLARCLKVAFGERAAVRVCRPRSGRITIR